MTREEVERAAQQCQAEGVSVSTRHVNHRLPRKGSLRDVARLLRELGLLTEAQASAEEVDEADDSPLARVPEISMGLVADPQVVAAHLAKLRGQTALFLAAGHVRRAIAQLRCLGEALPPAADELHQQRQRALAARSADGPIPVGEWSLWRPPYQEPISTLTGDEGRRVLQAAEQLLEILEPHEGGHDHGPTAD